MVMRVNGSLLPFLSPISLHPGVLLQGEHCSTLFQVSGLQRAIRGMAQYEMMAVEGWQALAPGEGG